MVDPESGEDDDESGNCSGEAAFGFTNGFRVSGRSEEGVSGSDDHEKKNESGDGEDVGHGKSNDSLEAGNISIGVSCAKSPRIADTSCSGKVDAPWNTEIFWEHNIYII